MTEANVRWMDPVDVKNSKSDEVSDTNGRYCTKCGYYKSWDMFEKSHSRGYMGKRADCRECRSKATMARRRKTPETWEHYTAVRNIWVKQQKWNSRYQHNLTLEQYEAFMTYHNNKCTICGSTDSLVIDHDHMSGTFRGCLCRLCNMAIGAFLDSIDVALATLATVDEERMTWRQRAAITYFGGKQAAQCKLTAYRKHAVDLMELNLHTPYHIQKVHLSAGKSRFVL